MGEKITYLTMANNDFNYLKSSIDNKFVYNGMCSMSQNICEKYLKHVIDITPDLKDKSDILKTHNLSKLRKYICNNIPNFKCDWKTVLNANNYYFSTRYPGEDSFIVDEYDIKCCWDAVQSTKSAVNIYIQSLNKSKLTLESVPIITQNIAKLLEPESQIEDIEQE